MANNIVWDNIVGNKTVDDGGYVGDLMELGLAHIGKALDDGRLLQSEAGVAYVQLIQSSYEQAIAFELLKELREGEVEQKDVEIELSTEKVVSEILGQENLMLAAETARYDLDYIKPKELELADQKIVSEELDQDGKIIASDTARYDLTYMKPEELALTREKIASEVLNKTNIVKQAELTGKQGVKTAKEVDLLNFELGVINPKKVQIMDQDISKSIADTGLMEQKEIAERIKNGMTIMNGPTVIEDSLYIAQIETQKKQAKLVERQTKGFEEEKDLRILKTQVDYATMIFDSAEDPDVLEIGKDKYITRLYNKMINPESQPLDTPAIPIPGHATTPQRISTLEADLKDQTRDASDVNDNDGVA